MNEKPAGQKTILVYGDSNSWGFIPGSAKKRFPPAIRWPGVMARELGPEWRVVDEALCGRTSAFDDALAPFLVERNGLKFFGAALESHLPLDVVVIFLGINDVKPRFALPPVDIASGVEKLIAVARNPLVGPEGTGLPPAVLVVCPPPIEEVPENLGPTYRGGAAKSRELRPFFRQMTARNNAPIVYAEDFVSVDPADGIHFSADAHGVLGREIARRVIALQQPPAFAAC